MSDQERTYVALKTMLLAVGLGVYFIGHVPSDPAARQIALWALVFASIGTLVVVAAAARPGWRVSQAMLWVLPIDLIALVLFSLLAAAPDAFYPVYVILALAYATTVPQREAYTATAAIALAHFVGDALTHPAGFGEAAMLVFETATVVFIGFVVTQLMAKQREREEDAISAAGDRELINAQLARRVGELQAVSEITELIHSSLDFDDVGPFVLDVLAKVIGIDALAVFVIDQAKPETLFSASIGVARMGSTGPEEPLAIAEVESYFTCMRVFDHESMMVLLCASDTDIAQLTDDDLLIIYAVASEIVVAVDNSRLYKLTRKLSVTDELTGMRNYRFLQQRLEDEVSRAIRYDKHLSLLMIDADDFKSFNDHHGHVAGDVALAEFRPVLRSVLREVDVIARYGGEEFAILLPETDAAGAFVAAEKIREAMSTHLFEDEDGKRCCTLTVSVGVATLPTYASDKESLLRVADDALYRAKNGGRNRVCTPKIEVLPETTAGDRQ